MRDTRRGGGGLKPHSPQRAGVASAGARRRNLLLKGCIIACSFLPFFALLHLSGPIDADDEFARLSRRKGGVEAALADCLPRLVPTVPHGAPWSELFFRQMSQYACCGDAAGAMLPVEAPPEPVDLDQLPADARALLNDGRCFIRPKLGPKFDICVHDVKHDNLVSKSLVQTGVWDIDTMRFLETALEDEPPGIVIDVGANIGLFSLAAASLGHTVFAFEPFSENAARLAASAVRNRMQGRLRLYRAALSDARHESEIVLEGTNRGGGSLRRRPADLREGVGRPRLLDDWADAVEGELGIARSGPAPTFLLLKLDVEGLEGRVLAGAARLLERQRPKFVALEVAPALMSGAGCSYRRVVDVLLSVGGYCAFERADFTGRLDAGNRTSVEDWAARAARLATDDLFLVRRGAGVAACP